MLCSFPQIVFLALRLSFNGLSSLSAYFTLLYPQHLHTAVPTYETVNGLDFWKGAGELAIPSFFSGLCISLSEACLC